MDSAIRALEQGILARGRANNNAAMAAKDGSNEGVVKASRDPNHSDSGEDITRGPAMDQAAAGRRPGDASM